ncbi:MAG: hypothetical protein E8D41_11595 [Nitrospira sp.]|nr:MAG: hypothetical protein E8D41_11595 [Nitrospira sp.]
MEPTAPIPQSPANGAGHRFSFFRSCTMVACVCLSVFGTASAVMSASTPPQIPLFAETAYVSPPPIAQALPEPRALKRWVRRQRTMTLNPAALDVMNRPRAEAQTDVTLNFFDTGLRTLNLDQPRGTILHIQRLDSERDAPNIHLVRLQLWSPLRASSDHSPSTVPLEGGLD